jgi:hypothetical protein
LDASGCPGGAEFSGDLRVNRIIRKSKPIFRRMVQYSVHRIGLGFRRLWDFLWLHGLLVGSNQRSM